MDITAIVVDMAVVEEEEWETLEYLEETHLEAHMVVVIITAVMADLITVAEVWVAWAA